MTKSRILGWLYRLTGKRSVSIAWMLLARGLPTLSSGPKHTRTSVGMTMTKSWPSLQSRLIKTTEKIIFQLMRQYGEQWFQSWRLEAYDFSRALISLGKALLSNALQDINDCSFVYWWLSFASEDDVSVCNSSVDSEVTAGPGWRRRVGSTKGTGNQLLWWLLLLLCCADF